MSTFNYSRTVKLEWDDALAYDAIVKAILDAGVSVRITEMEYDFDDGIRPAIDRPVRQNIVEKLEAVNADLRRAIAGSIEEEIMNPDAARQRLLSREPLKSPLNLVVLSVCPACGDDAERAWRKACSCACVRLNAVKFTDNGTIGAPHAESHLHLTCNECDFQWLAPLDDAEGVEGAW